MNCTIIKQLFSKKYEIYPSTCVHGLYPCEMWYGNIFFADGSSISIPKNLAYSVTTVWGRTGKTIIFDSNKFAVPEFISIAWLSFLENTSYKLDKAPLPKERIKELLEMTYTEDDERGHLYDELNIGMAPYGRLAIWLSGYGGTAFVAWLSGKETDIDIHDYYPNVEFSTEEYSQMVLANCKEDNEKKLQNEEFANRFGLPVKDLEFRLPGKDHFENYMEQFNYKIEVQFEDSEAVLARITMWYYNGEQDGMNLPMPGKHALHAMRAKPKKIVLDWDVNGSHYGGYFWIDEKKIVDTFSEFYEGNNSREAAFTITVDSSNKAYTFYLSDASRRVEIPPDGIELIIFRDKYESLRYNYDRPRGGWKY